MHYYTHNIADYRKDTSHLSMLEHGIYRSLIDWYYLDEAPIPRETQVVMRRLRLGSESDMVALQNVLSDFFELHEDGYHQARCDDELTVYQQKTARNRVNGKRGGRPRKTQVVISENPNESEQEPTRNPNKRPTNNQEPITNNSSRRAQRGTRLPEDWKPNDEQVMFCRTERPDLNPKSTGERFRDYWIAQPGPKGVKLNWDATWRNWVRNESTPRVKKPDDFSGRVR